VTRSFSVQSYISFFWFRFLGKEEEKGRRMAIFLVDLEFREKAKSLLTSRELAACVFLLLLALMPWSEVRFVPYNGGNLCSGSAKFLGKTRIRKSLGLPKPDPSLSVEIQILPSPSKKLRKSLFSTVCDLRRFIFED
jgi:hypothetical protein